MAWLNTSHKPKRGFSLLELMFAIIIGSMAIFMLISAFTMISRSLTQGWQETHQLNQAKILIERMTRQLNHAYTLDTTTVENRYQIDSDHRAITFTVPDDVGGIERYRFGYDQENRGLFLRQQNGTDWVSDRSGPLLGNVQDFLVDNQEGILSMVLVLQVDMGRNGLKRYSMVGRALPRNREIE